MGSSPLERRSPSDDADSVSRCRPPPKPNPHASVCVNGTHMALSQAHRLVIIILRETDAVGHMLLWLEMRLPKGRRGAEDGGGE